MLATPSSTPELNPPAPPAASTGPRITRGHSCVLCQQRKVRCDRQKPCSNCIKAGAECVTSAPSLPRRKRKKLSEVDLGVKLKHYEQLLKKAGVKVEDEEFPHDWETREYQKASQDVVGLMVPRASDAETGALFANKGESHYVENTLWENLRDEILDPKDPLPGSTSSDDETNETGMFPYAESLLVGHTAPSTSLTSLHPQPVNIFRLWQTYLTNVNPMVKMFHAPTVQQIILDASANLEKVSRPTEALMFSIYLLAVTSLTPAECERMFGETRMTLLSRYSHGAQQALINSKFLKSLNISTLQAYMLFLLGMRKFYDAHSIWILTGSAVRIAQRLGLHRDGSRYKISVFDAEMRRRTWWQIAFLDGHASKLAGAGFPSWLIKFDTKTPMNLSDSDLSPEMKDLPQEKEGATEMIFCCLRYEVAQTIRKYGAFSRDSDTIQLPTGIEHTPAKDKAIDDLEKMFQDKYLRFCDPSIPLHLLVVYCAKSVIASMKIMAHHPRQYPDKGASMTQTERDNLFRECYKILEVDNLGHSISAIQGYLWHVQHYFQLDAFIYVLSELRTRFTGDEVDRAWHQVKAAYDSHPDMLTNTKNALYFAIGNLCLKAWRAREAAGFVNQGGYQIGIPPYITQLRELRKGTELSKSGNDPRNAAQHAKVCHLIEHNPTSVMQQNNAFQQSADQFSNMDLALDMEMPEITSVDWEYWQTLMDGDLPAYQDDGNGFLN